MSRRSAQQHAQQATGMEQELISIIVAFGWISVKLTPKVSGVFFGDRGVIEDPEPGAVRLAAGDLGGDAAIGEAGGSEG